MSQETFIKTLTDLGLTQMDSKVYLFLAKRGLQKARDIAKPLKMNKQQLYRSLTNLQSKAIVSATLEHPARFSAVPFEKVLDLYVKTKMEEAQSIQHNKDKILSVWRSVAVSDTDTSARFMVIEGRSVIYSKIQQMIQETKSQLSTVSTVPDLLRADQFGLFEANYELASNSKIQFRFLTELSQQNAGAIKTLLKDMEKGKIVFEGRIPDLGLRLFPRMVVRDEEEILFFITPDVGIQASEQDAVCLWTNSKALVRAFMAIFEELWHNASDIQKKIIEIESGKPAPKTCVISNASEAKKTYDETLNSAKEEIIMVTSAKGLVASSENMTQIKKWAERGVAVKIMSPIMGENFQSAMELSKYSAVRHVAASYLGTTLVDGQHLFQFKNPSTNEGKPDEIPYFENTFYTNDHEYMEKTKNMLNDIWKNAHAPSANTLELITGGSPVPRIAAVSNKTPSTKLKIEKMSGFSLVDRIPAGTITEKDVLNKFINVQKEPAASSSKGMIMYCSTGSAIIHPPDYFNLPEMLIWIYHIEKQSAFGAEDALQVCLRRETQTDPTYVLMAHVGDNPGATVGWKRVLAGTPAAQNVQLVKKDEIQVRIHGNNLFAGWTKPVTLTPTLTLPPACILFEGHGDLITNAYNMVSPSGFKSAVEGNSFSAFVTFFHPVSQYSGPGTDGRFNREVIVTTTPPENKEKISRSSTSDE